MKPELDKLLCTKYPKLFSQRNKSPRMTSLCFGLQCESGWYLLIDNLCERIQTHCERMGYKQKMYPEITTIKEKFGGLRFYINGGDDAIYEYIREAEEDSYHVCEDCGTRDNVRTWYLGWNRTLCVDCAKKGPHPSYYTPFRYWYFTQIKSRWIRIIWWFKGYGK